MNAATLARMKQEEEDETPAQEKAESPAKQALERKYGIEKHTPDGKRMKAQHSALGKM